MIRYAFINRQVLDIYNTLPYLSFPINISRIIDIMPNCRYMSYQEFADVNDCSIEDVIQLCESKSGCTLYDASNSRYLILYNKSTDNNNNRGRQLWTSAHEIGHIVCKHFELSSCNKLSENRLSVEANKMYESEADYFAATLLAPFPLYKTLKIKSVRNIQSTFGLSAEAAMYRFRRYLDWESNHIKTSWENDMVRAYTNKASQHS